MRRSTGGRMADGTDRSTTGGEIRLISTSGPGASAELAVVRTAAVLSVAILDVDSGSRNEGCTL